jgi:hypothetical protein
MKNKRNSYSKKTYQNDLEASKTNIVVRCSNELQYLVSVLSAIDDKFKDKAQQSGTLDRQSVALLDGK